MSGNFCFEKMQYKKGGILLQTGKKGEYTVKNKKAFIFSVIAVSCLAGVFFALFFQKSPYSKMKPLNSVKEMTTEFVSVSSAKTENTVTELTPDILKEGTLVFSEISVLELNGPMEQKKEIINSAVLSPVKTNHPVLDNLIEQRFASTVNTLPDTFSKAKFCYDWLLENTKFSGGTVNMQNMYAFLGECDYNSTDAAVVYDAYRMLLTGQGVCDNYASALTVLYRYIGLNAFPVYGKAVLEDGNCNNHVWVAVEINGKFYCFDPQIEAAATRNGIYNYALFCIDAAKIPFYTDYSLTESSAAFGNFSLRQPMQAVCTVGQSAYTPIVYIPAEVNAYGEVVKKVMTVSDKPNGDVPITVSVCGGAQPYHCTVKAELQQNGQCITAEILENDSVTDSVTFCCKTPQNAEYNYITVRITDCEGRNLVVVFMPQQ